MLRLLVTGGSPYSRKVRIVLAEKGIEFDQHVQSASKRPLDVFSKQNPNLAVPVLIDGEMTIFESNLIIEYLLHKFPGENSSRWGAPLAQRMTRPDHRWHDAKVLATLEAMADIIVNMKFYLSSGVDVANVAYGRRQQTRFNTCLDWLEEQATAEGFVPGVFSVQDINLICPLTYLDARGEILKDTLDWRGRPRLESIMNLYRQRPSVASTMPGPAENAVYSNAG